MRLTLGKQLWEWRAVWLTAPAVAGLVLLLRLSGWLQPYEWMALDQFFRWRPSEAPDPRMVIVGISEQDLRDLKHWPIDDRTLATVLKKIKQQSPLAIGLDLHRDFPIEPGHSALLDIYKTTPNLIAIEKRGGREDVPVAPPPELKAAGQVASNDIVMDQDGKIRRALLYWFSPDGQDAQETLGFRLALDYLEVNNHITPTNASQNANDFQLGQTVFPAFQSNDGSYVHADAGGYQILLNYRKTTPDGAGSFRRVSLMDVLRDRIPPNLMRGRLVFVGATAYSIKDMFYTPYSDNSITTPEMMPGVEIQANIASQILSSVLEKRSSIQSWEDWQEILWIFVWAGVGTGLGWIARSPSLAISGMVISAGSLVILCYVAFLKGVWIPVVPTALALITSAGILTSYVAYLEREERQTIMNIFGRHVTPKIAETIWRDRDQFLTEGRLLGRKMTATVLFTDLKDFSTVSERTDPEILMSWLNEYMEAMTQIVLDHGGIVDKFIGDSIMAVFGVPIARTTPAAIAHDAYEATTCAVKMAEVLATLNQKWQSQGRPTTSMRVGISTGPVVTGSLGGRQRLDYTTIGDSVNVASRLESFDKTIGVGLCRILISENTYEWLENKFPVKLIASVQLKGREQPTKIYQILLESGEKPLSIPSQNSD